MAWERACSMSDSCRKMVGHNTWTSTKRVILSKLPIYWLSHCLEVIWFACNLDEQQRSTAQVFSDLFSLVPQHGGYMCMDHP